MTISLFIDRGPLEHRLAVIENDRIAEVHVHRIGAPGTQGQIRRARVTHVSHDLQAATVDAGDGLSLFLRAADARTLAPESTGKIPIGKLVSRGQNLLVQVGRAQTEGKQDRCSTDIALRGRYLVLHPSRTGLDVPRGVDADNLSGLRTMAEQAHISVRPAARQVEADALVAEAARLLADWESMPDGHGKPGLLSPAPDLVDRALIDFAGPDPEAIMVPDRETRAALVNRAKIIAPDLAGRILLTETQRSLDLDDEIEGALQPEVPFSGGQLIIEETRAMTVIDIDGSGQPAKLNMAAIPEIARQVRLRQIGGAIAIDFVTMGKSQDRKRVETALRQAFQHDPEQADVGGLDRFGIATMVRRSNGPSLMQRNAVAAGAQPQFSAAAQLARALRRVVQDLASVGPLPITIELSDQLQSAAPADLAQRLSSALNRPLSIRFGPRAVDDIGLQRER